MEYSLICIQQKGNYKSKQMYKSELEKKMAAKIFGSVWASLNTMTGLQHVHRNSIKFTLETFKIQELSDKPVE